MRLLLPCSAIILVQCTLSYAFKLNDEYIEVHEIDKNMLPPLVQLPPRDPAVHSFPTEPAAPLVPTCTKQGYFRDPFNCRKFYHCQHEDAVPKGFYCQPDLIFNTANNHCDSPGSVEC